MKSKAPSQFGILDQLCRSLLSRHFRGLRDGQLRLFDTLGALQLGDPRQELHVNLRVHRPCFYRRAILGGDLGVAASYMDRDWDADDLTQFVRLMIRNLNHSDRLNRTLAVGRQAGARLCHAWRRNSKTGAQRNIEAHYDLGNDFFARFLDPTLNYSCGLFPTWASSMQEASRAKMHRVAEWLELRPNEHVLEIGSGWGGLAVFLAQEYGVRVTTTTISKKQYHYVREQVAQAGLAHRVQVLRKDYRELQGTFDKLVSIEMIEAVGHHYFDRFFRQCSRLLSDRGLMFLQSIVIRDQRYLSHIRGIDFIRYYIFPGGCLPSLQRLLSAMTRATDLRLVHCHDLSEHYVCTLQRWRAAFSQEQESVAELGFGPRFQRMWEYYLCYCEAAFSERQVGLTQILFAKPKAPTSSIPGEEQRLSGTLEAGFEPGQPRTSIMSE